jgi:hypothetical protein
MGYLCPIAIRWSEPRPIVATRQADPATTHRGHATSGPGHDPSWPRDKRTRPRPIAATRQADPATTHRAHACIGFHEVGSDAKPGKNITG